MIPNLSIRNFISDTLKTFPWQYSKASTTLLAVLDSLVAAHVKSWSGIERWSFNDVTVKKIQHFFNTGQLSLQLFTDFINNRYNIIDKRERFITSTDDTHQVRYGKNVYGASYYKSHVNKGNEYGNTLVTNQISSKSYHSIDFKVYLAKRCIEKSNLEQLEFQTKAELAETLFLNSINSMTQKGIQKKQIYCTSDSWYISKPLVALFREQGVKFVIGCKKNTKLELFNSEFQLGTIEPKILPWKRHSDPKTGSILYYKVKTYVFKTYGRLRIFMIKRGTDSRIKFYATNNLKMTISTFCAIWKDHWGIETFHNYSKCFFGLEKSYSGMKNTNITHWKIVILLYLLFCHFKRKYTKIYHNLTMYNLWELY